MPGRTAALTVALYVLAPTVLIALVIAWLPAWSSDRFTDGTAVLRYGYLPEDRGSALAPYLPLRPATVRLHDAAVDDYGICTQPGRWAATLVAEDAVAYWALLRPLGAQDEPAQVLRLPKSTYLLRVVPLRERPRNGEPWTRPAC
ncbi:hypothetical protein Psuf_021090 [Phytohabitans suffuscus]|uniref:Uncharacterized protein n=1 Tax=Phytohabitans suffuscus TaxID=624315 RepID=A0A6F8YFC1_9ACTN|nr:hypothetical protein Psuf_021090 [Phytohabitans suffuscus]